MKKVQQTQQKSTFGDMDELVALKESMTKKEKNPNNSMKKPFN